MLVLLFYYFFSKRSELSRDQGNLILDPILLAYYHHKHYLDYIPHLREISGLREDLELLADLLADYYKIGQED